MPFIRFDVYELLSYYDAHMICFVVRCGVNESYVRVEGRPRARAPRTFRNNSFVRRSARHRRTFATRKSNAKRSTQFDSSREMARENFGRNAHKSGSIMEMSFRDKM